MSMKDSLTRPSKTNSLESMADARKAEQIASMQDEEPTKRTSLVVPVSLHKEYKQQLIDEGISLQDDLLDLLRKRVEAKRKLSQK